VLTTIAREYLATIAAIQHGSGDVRALEGQRGVLHQQLCELLNQPHDRRFDMVREARRIVSEHREGIWR
jgi:hypothetical protein